MSDVFKMLEAEGHDTGIIWQEIKSLTGELMEILYPFILHNYRMQFVKKSPQHFHILGIDIILDNNCKPWLLEINDRPSLSISHEDEIGTTDLKNKMHISEIDLAIKGPLVYDTIRLAVKNSENI
jgi:tubulin polyglutamylase TTLL6/13